MRRRADLCRSRRGKPEGGALRRDARLRRRRIPRRHSRHGRRRARDERGLLRRRDLGHRRRAWSASTARGAIRRARKPPSSTIGYRACARRCAPRGGVVRPPHGSRFTPGDGEASRARSRSCSRRRIATQPLGLPNAGSVFRNPPGDHAARLIEACGLKGFAHRRRARVGEARQLHRQPDGAASAADIEALDPARQEDRPARAPASSSSRKCASSGSAA